MKTIGVSEARERLAEILDDAQGETVCIVRHGKPLAVVVGVEGQELMQVLEQHNRAPASKARRSKNARV
jgi:prevent-host-death family protein